MAEASWAVFGGIDGILYEIVCAVPSSVRSPDRADAGRMLMLRRRLRPVNKLHCLAHDRTTPAGRRWWLQLSDDLSRLLTGPREPPTGGLDHVGQTYLEHSSAAAERTSGTCPITIACPEVMVVVRAVPKVQWSCRDAKNALWQPLMVPCSDRRDRARGASDHRRHQQ